MSQKKEGTVRTTVRLPEALLADLEREASRRGVTISDILTERALPASSKGTSVSKTPTPASVPVAHTTMTEQERFLQQMRDYQRQLERVTSKFHWFRLPIASCPCREPEPWYVAPDHYEEMLALCEPWVASGGFTLHEEPPLEWNQSTPWDKFTPNIPPLAHRTVGTGMRMALKYFRKMWFEISDVDKALAYLATHSDLPLAVGNVDLVRYNDDADYKDVVDLCDKYVLYWHDNNKPMPLNDDDYDDDYLD